MCTTHDQYICGFYPAMNIIKIAYQLLLLVGLGLGSEYLGLSPFSMLKFHRITGKMKRERYE